MKLRCGLTCRFLVGFLRIIGFIFACRCIDAWQIAQNDRSAGLYRKDQHRYATETPLKYTKEYPYGDIIALLHAGALWHGRQSDKFADLFRRIKMVRLYSYKKQYPHNDTTVIHQMPSVGLQLRVSRIIALPQTNMCNISLQLRLTGDHCVSPVIVQPGQLLCKQNP